MKRWGKARPVKADTWKTITPDALVVPVEYIREMFSEGVWKCSWVTQQLCFAALHPDDKQTDIEQYIAAFRQYRVIIGWTAAQEFDQHYQVGTPPAIFHAYFQAMDAGIRIEIRRLFNDPLKIAVTQTAKVKEHPAEWAKLHLGDLINGKKQVVITWIKCVCDRQDYSSPLNTQQEREDLIYWRDWRAPKLIYMQPSGNMRYDPSTAWTRENETTIGELLDAFSDRFIQFLGFGLDKLAGNANVALAQMKPVAKERTVDKSKSEDDRLYAAMAIEEARKSVPEDERPHPKVGAVVVKDGKVLRRSNRARRERTPRFLAHNGL
jgi:hypothetical protein